MSEANVWQPGSAKCCELVVGVATTNYTLANELDKVWLDIKQPEEAIAGITITCPVDVEDEDLDLPTNFVHQVSNYSPLPAEIVGEVGVTIVYPADVDEFIPQYATAIIKKSAAEANTYIVSISYLGSEPAVATNWGAIGGTLADQTDLQAVLQDLQDTKANLRYTTLEVTSDLTLIADHLGLMLYTLVGTAGPFVITVPAGLGDGFHVSMIHRGTSTVTFAGSGATVNAQTGGTLVLAQDGRASLVGCGASNIYDLVGVVVAA